MTRDVGEYCGLCMNNDKVCFKLISNSNYVILRNIVNWKANMTRDGHEYGHGLYAYVHSHNTHSYRAKVSFNI